MTKQKKADELTTEGLAQRLFPKEVREEAKKEAQKADKRQKAQEKTEDQ